MQIEYCNHKSKCDFMGCNNLAKYSLSTKGRIKRELCFCEDCLMSIYEEVAKMKVPKGTKSPFKLNEKFRRKDERE